MEMINKLRFNILGKDLIIIQFQNMIRNDLNDRYKFNQNEIKECIEYSYLEILSYLIKNNKTVNLENINLFENDEIIRYLKKHNSNTTIYDECLLRWNIMNNELDLTKQKRNS